MKKFIIATAFIANLFALQTDELLFTCLQQQTENHVEIVLSPLLRKDSSVPSRAELLESDDFFDKAILKVKVLNKSDQLVDLLEITEGEVINEITKFVVIYNKPGLWTSEKSELKINLVSQLGSASYELNKTFGKDKKRSLKFFECKREF